MYPREVDNHHILDDDDDDVEFPQPSSVSNFKSSPRVAKLQRNNSLSNSLRPNYDPAGAVMANGEKQWRVKISSVDGKKMSPKIVGVSYDHVRIYDSQGKELRWEYPISEVNSMTADPAVGLFAFIWKRNESHSDEHIHLFSKKHCTSILEAVNKSTLEFARGSFDAEQVGLAGSIYNQPQAPGSPKGLGRLVGRPASPSSGVKEIAMNGPLLTDPALASPKKSPRNSPRGSPKILTLSRKGKVSRPTFSPLVQRKNPLSKSLDFLAPVPSPENQDSQYQRF
jgi:hypothetical protein